MFVSEDAIRARFPTATVVELRNGGANGDIYFVRLPDGDRAVKVVDPGLSKERHERELIALQRVSSAYVVAYRGHGTITEDGIDYPYIEMDWVEARSLAEQLADIVTWPIARRVTLIEQLCDGLDAIGAQNVVHRDFKPGNLMVGEGGVPIIVDLGWARLTDVSSITTIGRDTGSRPYNSPEQYRHEAIDPRSDIFAAGIVAYEILAGRHPFQEADGTFNMAALLEGRPLVGLLTAADVPEEVAAVVERMISPDRAGRPRRGIHAAEDLQRALAGATPTLPIFPRPVFLPYLGQNKSHLRTGFFTTVSAHGLVLELRVNAASHAAKDLARAPSPYRLIDPSSVQSCAGFKRNDTYKSHKSLPVGIDPTQLDSEAGALAFTRPFIDTERALGVDLLVAPYVHADVGQMQNVDRSLRCAEQALGHAAGLPVLAGVSIDSAFVEDPTVRRGLLDKLTGSGLEGFFFLVQDGRTDFSQVDRPDFLTGLRNLVETLRSSRQVAFFARIGAVGIPLVACGAGGFSTGIEARSMRVVGWAPDGATPTGGQQPVGRFYERSLFSLLRYTESRKARVGIDPDTGNPALGPCDCTFCANGPDLMASATTWSGAAEDRAARHMVWALTQDVDQLRALPLRDRTPWLKSRLATAVSEREGLRRAKVVVQSEGNTPDYANWQAAFL